MLLDTIDEPADSQLVQMALQGQQLMKARGFALVK